MATMELMKPTRSPYYGNGEGKSGLNHFYTARSNTQSAMIKDKDDNESWKTFKGRNLLKTPPPKTKRELSLEVRPRMELVAQSLVEEQVRLPKNPLSHIPLASKQVVLTHYFPNRRSGYLDHMIRQTRVNSAKAMFGGEDNIDIKPPVTGDDEMRSKSAGTGIRKQHGDKEKRSSLSISYTESQDGDKRGKQRVQFNVSPVDSAQKQKHFQNLAMERFVVRAPYHDLAPPPSRSGLRSRGDSRPSSRPSGNQMTNVLLERPISRHFPKPMKELERNEFLKSRMKQNQASSEESEHVVSHHRTVNEGQHKTDEINFQNGGLQGHRAAQGTPEIGWLDDNRNTVAPSPDASHLPLSIYDADGNDNRENVQKERTAGNFKAYDHKTDKILSYYLAQDGVIPVSSTTTRVTIPEEIAEMTPSPPPPSRLGTRHKGPSLARNQPKNDNLDGDGFIHIQQRSVLHFRERTLTPMSKTRREKSDPELNSFLAKGQKPLCCYCCCADNNPTASAVFDHVHDHGTL